MKYKTDECEREIVDHFYYLPIKQLMKFVDDY